MREPTLEDVFLKLTGKTLKEGVAWANQYQWRVRPGTEESLSLAALSYKALSADEGVTKVSLIHSFGNTRSS